MLPHPNRNAHAAEIQEDVSRDEIVSAFRSAMVGHFRAHVPGTNINESTLLSSDYLDHFNELVTLFETLATEPEGFAEDLRAWRPLTYEERFSQSSFRGKALAVAAYRQAPHEARTLFDDAVARLQGEALSLVARVGAKLGTGQILEGACQEAVGRLRVLIAEANAIATGELPAGPAASGAQGDRDSQAAVHPLFGKNLARFDP
jgi:hypothetical protein